MSEKKRFALPRRLQGPLWRGLAGLWIVLLLTAIGVTGSKRWYPDVAARYDRPVTVSWEITEKEELQLPEAAAAFGVKRWYAAYGADRTLVAYVVDTATKGYRENSTIEVESVIRADGELLAGMQVLYEKEDRDRGGRIALDSFAERFRGRYLPLLSMTQAGRGSHVDGLSGATASSEAVLRAVNGAHAFLQAVLPKGVNAA